MLFDNDIAGLATLEGSDGRCREANAAFAAALGFADAATLIGISLVESVFAPETRRRWREALRDGGTLSLREARVIDPRGRSRWVHLWAERRDDGISMVVVDVTAQRDALETARGAESRFRALVEGGLEGLALVVDDRIHACNQAMARMLGYTREELVGLEIRALCTPASFSRVMHRIRAGDETPYEVEGLRKDGSIVAALLHGKNASYDGRPARITSLLDLSEQKAAEAVLREREERYRELAELLPVSVAETDREGRVTFINRMGARLMMPNDPSAAMGQRVIDLVAEEDRDRAADNLRRRMLGEDVGDAEYTLLNGNGDRFPGRIYVGPILRGGEVVGVRAAVVDLTERARAEEENRRLQESMLATQKLESLGVLTGGIAHDFNNLLAAIRGNADLAQQALSRRDLAGSAHNLDAIERATERASHLTKQLLAYSGRRSVELEDVDLNALVADMVELLQVSISKKAELSVDLSSEVPRVHADVSQLQQVVMNVVINASEAMEGAAGRIEVRTAIKVARGGRVPCFDALQGRRCAVFEVTDRGVGMEEATIQRIFDPFFTTKFAGRGLGLAAVAGIVRSHGGAIDVKSEPGAGTQFSVWLPAVVAERGPKVDPVRPRAALVGRGTILIADDERALRLMLRAMLEDLGFSVIEAADGESCLGQLRDHPDDLRALVLDMTMPRKGGLDVLAQMESWNRRLPTILCSGYQDPQGAERFAARQPLSFLQKPFTLQQLEDTLAALLDAAED